MKRVRWHPSVKARVVDQGARGVAGRGRVGTEGHRGPGVGRIWSCRGGSGGRYPLAGEWGVHAGEGRCARFGVKAATQLHVSLVFSRGHGVDRPCLGLECPSLCDVRCDRGFELRDGGVETVGSPHQSTATKFVFVFRQLGRAAVGGLLGLSKAGLDFVKGDPDEL